MKSICNLALILALTPVISKSFASNTIEIDHTKITQNLVSQYVNGWQNGKGKEFAKVFADDSHFVNIFGMYFKGREENAQRHDQILKTFLKGTQFNVESIRSDLVRDDVIVAHVTWNLKNFSTEVCKMNPEENSLRCPRRGIFNHVIVPKRGKQNNKDGASEWEIIETQNTLIQMPPKSKN